MMEGMVRGWPRAIDTNDKQIATLAQVKGFLTGTTSVDFAVAVDERYDFIARTLQRFGYRLLPRADKGVVLRFLERVSGYSRQQLTRLVKRGAECRPLTKGYCASRRGWPTGWPRARATSFARTYTSADVRLLAHTDTLHSTLSGLATKKLMALGHPVERAYGIFGDARYERLAVISVAHLYNLRRHAGYQRLPQVWAKTRPVTVAIGERRAPSPNHPPGYLRVDSVHQGDQDGIKGVYHINGPRPPRRPAPQ